MRVLDECDVQVAIRRTANGIARRVAKGELRRRGERSGVEVPGGRAKCRRECRIGNDVGPLHGKSSEGVVVGCLRHRGGHAGLHLEDGVESPAAEDNISRSR